jgi:hypothetical protein
MPNDYILYVCVRILKVVILKISSECHSQDFSEEILRMTTRSFIYDIIIIFKTQKIKSYLINFELK